MAASDSDARAAAAEGMRAEKRVKSEKEEDGPASFNVKAAVMKAQEEKLHE